MSKATALTLGMMSTSLLLTLSLIGGVVSLFDGSVVPGLFALLVIAPLFYALYITFGHVKEQIAPTPSRPQSDVESTPWESDPGHTKDPY